MRRWTWLSLGGNFTLPLLDKSSRVPTVRDPQVSASTVTPETILRLNRNHKQIEIMHRDKDVTMGEDRYTNRSDHAPRNIFALTGAAITLLKRISKSPTRAIELVQDNRAKAIALIAGAKIPLSLNRPALVWILSAT